MFGLSVEKTKFLYISEDFRSGSEWIIWTYSTEMKVPITYSGMDSINVTSLSLQTEHQGFSLDFKFSYYSFGSPLYIKRQLERIGKFKHDSHIHNFCCKRKITKYLKFIILCAVSNWECWNTKTYTVWRKDTVSQCHSQL